MNIFILDENPDIAAQMMCDKHVVKMFTESAQMLSTAVRILDGVKTKRLSKSGKRMVPYYEMQGDAERILMKAVHFRHPCTIWTMESEANYRWHWEHLRALCKEYTYRYGKICKVERERLGFLETPPKNIPKGELTPFKLAMGQYPMCMDEDPVKAYHNYYHAAKPFATWEKGRPAPNWWKGYQGAHVYS